MEIYGAIVRFFQHGGIFMFPIAVVLALGLAVAIERLLYLKLTASKNAAEWRQIAPMLAASDLNAVDHAVGRSDTALAALIGYGLNRVRQGWHREDVQRALESSMMDTIPMVEKRTHYLATFANVATLLGLLGTIMGLIHAFSAVSSANAAEKAALLSYSISEALNCTAFGLLVAIPFMLIHSRLQALSAEIIDTLETATAKLLDAVTEYQMPAAQAPARAAQPAARPGTQASMATAGARA
jgi:biopolymer transport protein ExbB/TolQ